MSTIQAVIPNQLVEDAKSNFLQANRIVILAHKSPDGDAIGSGLALLNVLKGMGKQVQLICPDSPAKSLLFLPGADELLDFSTQSEASKEHILAADLICFVDFNAISRLGEELVNTLNASKAKTVLIDHHPNSEARCDVMISLSSQPATCQLMYYFLTQAGWHSKITPAVGDCLYTGIMTDTGFLAYNSSTAATYQIIADLLNLGVNKTEIHDHILNDYTETRLQLLSYAIHEKMTVLEEYHTAYISLSLEELARFNYEAGDLEGLVNTPLQMPNVHFTALFTESEHLIKASFRSKRSFPANQFSQDNFEGGGHLNAAGGKSHLSLEQTVSKFVSLLPNYKELLQKS